MIVLFNEEHFNPIGQRFLKKVLMYLSAVHLATDGVAWLKKQQKMASDRIKMLFIKQYERYG